ncbi:MAG: hypothetical protein WBC55_01955 [Dehalococcoidia bacterium]
MVNLAEYVPTGSLRAVLDRDVEDMLPRHGIADAEVGSVWVGVFQMPVTRLHSDIYELRQPIWVQVERYGQGYLVTDEDVDRHGVGLTTKDALHDYEEVLLGYFESLMRRHNKLSKRLRQHLEFLIQRIKRLE